MNRVSNLIYKSLYVLDQIQHIFDFAFFDFKNRQAQELEWLPVYLSADHWKRARPLFQKAIVALSDRTSKASHAEIGAQYGGVYGPDDAITLLLRMMNTFCVLLCDGGHSKTDRLLNGYCMFHRLLLAVLLENPASKNKLKLRLKRFLSDEVREPHPIYTFVLFFFNCAYSCTLIA